MIQSMMHFKSSKIMASLLVLFLHFSSSLFRVRPYLTYWLCLLYFCPCSPRHAAHQLSKSNAATGGFVSIHIIIPSCYFVFHQNTLKQLECHILMPQGHYQCKQANGNQARSSSSLTLKTTSHHCQVVVYTIYRLGGGWYIPYNDQVAVVIYHIQSRWWQVYTILHCLPAGEDLVRPARQL